MASDVQKPDPLKGAVAGLAAGLLASLVMNGFQAAVAALSSDDGDSGEPSTAKAADRVAVATTGQPVPEDYKGVAGNVVHYAFGAALGVGYGVAAEYRPEVTAAFGVAFGLAVAALADEAVVPAAGLSPPPSQTPAGTHVYGLVSHIVFGAVAEGSRRLLRNAA